MTHKQRDRLLLLLLRFQMRNEVVIKHILGITGAALLSDADNLAVRVRDELQEVEANWLLNMEQDDSENETVH